MTKAELIAKIAGSAAISKNSAEQSLNALLDAIQEALATDGKLSLRNPTHLIQGLKIIPVPPIGAH